LAFFQAIAAAEYVLGLVPKGTHEYAKLIRPSELAAAARRHGLNVIAEHGLTYNPITQRYRLTPNTRVNYMMATQKP
jgi:2-polyprenyl-6-hydroxyphenyl methylase/3-demethylubiquinone-9 3-methyltransferase